MSHTRATIALTLALLLCGGTQAAAAPASPPPKRPPPPAAAPSSGTRGSVPAPREYRFDALRFAGELSGPQALIARGRRAAERPSLLRLRRSFVRRIFETVEAPALQR